MFSKFNEDARKVLINMQKEMVLLKHPYIGSEHLFLSILKYKKGYDVNSFEEKGITYDSFRNELIKVVGIGKESNDYYLYTPMLRNILESASLCAGDKGKDKVDIGDLISAIFSEGEGVAVRILLGMGIDVLNLYEEFVQYSDHIKSNKLLVDNYGVDLTLKAKNVLLDPVIGRDKELKRLLEILSRRTKNNPLLIGEAGVGKTAIVEELARMIINGSVPNNLVNKRIVSLSMASLVAGTKYRGEFEERVEKIISELESVDDVILFIDEIHTLVGAGGAEGAIDASNILKPALARGKIRLIGATTIDEYKQFVLKDKALDRRFQTITIEEPSLSVTKDILYELRPIYEKFHKVKISDEVLDKILELSNKYIYNRKMPDKVIDVLDEVCSRVSILSLNKKRSVTSLEEKIKLLHDEKNKAIIDNDFKNAYQFRKQELECESKKNKLEFKNIKESYRSVTVKDVKEVVESKANVVIYDGNNYLKDFTSILNKKVIGQEHAVNELYKAIKLLRCGYNETNKPYSFLFVGPSGVGKTLLAKEFTKLCYGIDNYIRLDMSEYKEEYSISKVIGAPPGYVGYNDNNSIFERVKDKPYSVILLDEIEQASKSVLSLFLQILDEGKAKDSKGNIVRFDNTIIIMTSNIGVNKNLIGFINNNDDKISDELKSYFGIPFLNRIDKVIYFNKLNKDNILDIINNKIKSLKKKYKDMGVNIKISKDVVLSLVDLVNYDLYGARRVDKVVEEKIESYIIDQVLIDNNNIVINNINIFSK